MFAMSGDVVDKFTAPAPVPWVASRSEASSSEWGPLARRRDGTVQRVVMEQPRPFDVDAAEAAFALL